LKKTYQIEKQRAAQQFRKRAGATQEQLQFALPLPEVVNLVQCGLLHLAVAAFAQLAEQMMRWEVSSVVGPTSSSRVTRPVYPVLIHEPALW